MPETDPPPRAKRRSSSAAQTRQTPKAAKAQAADPVTDAQPSDAPSSPIAKAVDTVGTAETPTAAIEPEATSDSAEEQAAPTTTPTAAVDPFDYDQSTLTLSFSFLPLAAEAAGRTVIVSVHSKNGTGKAVLPEFIAPLHESELRLPASVLQLLERYRTVTLPKRKAEAEAKAAALATKRPVTQSKGKGLRPEHVTAKTTSRVKPGVATQTKLKFGK